MSRYLSGMDRNLYPANRIFNAYVAIEFDARIQRQMFQLRPARRIRRRYSVSATPRQNREARPSISEEGRPIHRRHSVAGTPSAGGVSRLYVCPDELRSAIENIRNQIGKFCFV